MGRVVSTKQMVGSGIYLTKAEVLYSSLLSEVQTYVALLSGTDIARGEVVVGQMGASYLLILRSFELTPLAAESFIPRESCAGDRNTLHGLAHREKWMEFVDV